jgi:general secretion pathway protein G
MHAQKYRREGFTLIELALVITLLGLLSAIAIPTYRGYVDRARENGAIADIGMMQLQLYRWDLNTGAFPATLAEAGLGGPDPWGNPYQYANIALSSPADVRKDKNLNPINTDFDLYSMGRDGVTVRALTALDARDDIVRANNGAFIGRGEDY